MADLARNRRVLDIGCIDHSAAAALEQGDAWLHHRLSQVAAHLVGVDVLEDDAAELNARGYSIRVADCEALDLAEQFDLVIAGDVIEHLANPGLFLEGIRRHLVPDGRVVITTPNPFSVEQAAWAMLRDRLNVNPQHTLWLDPIVSWELLGRFGFSVVGFHWIDTRFHFRLKGRIRGRLANLMVDRVMHRHPLTRRDFAIVAKAEMDSSGPP